MPGAKPGERRGGRKKGSPNKATRARQALLAAGIEPRDMMLENMRIAREEAVKAEAAVNPASVGGETREEMFERVLAAVRRVVDYRMIAQKCAEGAAPYCHPKLQAVTHSNDQDKPVAVQVTWKSEPNDTF